MIDKEALIKLKQIEYAIVPGTLLTDEPLLKPKYYFHSDQFEEEGYYFLYVIGVRGAGKTVDGLTWLKNNGDGIMVRRTDPEFEIMLEEINNPFNPMIKLGMISAARIKKTRTKLYMMYIIENESSEERFICEGVALNTFASTRSADFSFAKNVFWDEFIKQPDQKEFKAEGSAWLNMLETIARSKHHINVRAYANSNDIYNPVFKELRVINQLERLLDAAQHETQVYKDPKRHIKIVLYKPTKEFEIFKSALALHDLTEGTQYADMAYNNQFTANDFSDCDYRNIKGYRPYFGIDDYTIFKHKGSKDIYVSYANADCFRYYSKFPLDQENLRNKYYNIIRNRWLGRYIIFESYDIKRRMLELFKLI